jgi:predicted AlkP superfamily pyrophosphatase or phosphodiesterase
MRHRSPPFAAFRRIFLAVCLSGAMSAACVAAAESHSSLVIVVDGLRPDYVTPELMPNLHAFGEAGVIGEQHHAVFPTVTRVNSSSISTGTYPRAHGLMHNTIFLPDASPDPIDTGDAFALLSAEQKTRQLLTARTLGELLAQAGKKVLVVSSGTTGSALLLNPTLPEGAALLSSRDLVRPPSLRARADAVLGPAPASAYPNRAGNRWAIDAYLEIGLKEIRPDVTLMWLTDPDGTAHRFGPGAPKTVEALRHIDEELGRLFAALSERGLRDRTNIFITADHGFSTHGGPFNLNALLTVRGLADGVKVVGGAQIYVQTGGDEKIRQIVRALQETDWVGALFTRAKSPGSNDGFVPGTLSFDAVHYQHPRAADILVDPNWSHAKNQHGYAGTTTSGGVAGHGSSSPYDVRIRLTAAGPDLKRAIRSSVPTGNIDLAVTLCHLHGVKPAPTMAGRVVSELLRAGPSSESVRVERTTHRVSTAITNGTYELELHKVRVGATEYVAYTQTKR